MRYVFISDVHGQYDKMLDALSKADFDMEKDTIVSVGDPFDRGPDSRRVLDFLMRCPNRILIWGNHDARLNQLIHKPWDIVGADFQNGITETLDSFAPALKGYSTTDKLYHVSTMIQLSRYFRECVWAIEFKDLIATHAWVPYTKWMSKYTIIEDWRNLAAQGPWFECSWGNSRALAIQNQWPDKKLLIGHWWAWDLAEALGGEKRFDNKKEWVNADIFENEHLIAIDGCSNYLKGGKVNAYVYESDEKPITYPRRETLLDK